MSDYERMARAITFIVEHAGAQPKLEDVAAHVHLSPLHFQRVFARWAGVTPKRFLQVVTVERAKRLLAEGRPVLAVADAVGLSSGSRLHDHFVHLEAVTPGEHGAGRVEIAHGVHETPFGPAFVATTRRGVCRLAFADAEDPGEVVRDLARRWPRADLYEDSDETAAAAQAIFQQRRSAGDRPLSVCVSGTNFQVSVWRALLAIPPGRLATYRRLAEAIGKPGSARAVGNAVGANPVGFLIPCHRVIRETGALGGYRWGADRKRVMLAWEAARAEPGPDGPPQMGEVAPSFA